MAAAAGSGQSAAARFVLECALFALARVRSELRRELLARQLRRDQLYTQQRQLQRERYTQPAAGDQLATVAEQLAAIEAELVQLQAQLAQLRITAPVAGCVFPMTSDSTNAEAGETGSHSWPLAAENRGTQLTVGTLLCRIGQSDRMIAQLVVDQLQIQQVKPGQPVRMQLQSRPDEILTGTVESIADEPLENAPASLTTTAGGDLAVKSDARGGLQPLSCCYEVRVRLPQGELNAQRGLRGRARILTGRQTLAAQWWTLAMRTFHFEL